MDYDDVARKLIVYSRSLAKGSLSAAGGASVGEAPVLQYLSGIDGDVIPSEIAKKLKFSRARMSHILDSLESKGYVQRRTDPNDRRRVLVSITEEGRDFAAKKKCRECGIALETTLSARRARCPGARAHPE